MKNKNFKLKGWMIGGIVGGVYALISFLFTQLYVNESLLKFLMPIFIPFFLFSWLIGEIMFGPVNGRTLALFWGGLVTLPLFILIGAVLGYLFNRKNKYVLIGGILGFLIGIIPFLFKKNYLMIIYLPIAFITNKISGASGVEEWGGLAYSIPLTIIIFTLIGVLVGFLISKNKGRGKNA